MKINVAQQLKGHIGESRSYTIDETSSEGIPIKGEATLILTNRSILVTGQLETTMKSTCSRCLEDFDLTFNFRIEDEFFPTGNILIEGHVRVDEESEGFVISENHILDLSEAVRQNTTLNLPAKQVCQPACAGLCQQCGCNLNLNRCDCTVKQVDSRWTPLENMFTQ